MCYLRCKRLERKNSLFRKIGEILNDILIQVLKVVTGWEQCNAAATQDLPDFVVNSKRPK